MRLGIVSDTHGDTEILHKIVSCAGIVEHWLHAGDNYEDAFFLSSLTDTPVTVVAGNCDYKYIGAPQDEFLDINGAKLWLTHGHKYNVKYTTDGLLRQGIRYGVDIVVFGHTHIPYSKFHDGILVFNPGSPCYPRGKDCLTFGIITVSGKKDIKADIIEIE